jgi:hypothetical protein
VFCDCNPSLDCRSAVDGVNVVLNMPGLEEHRTIEVRRPGFGMLIVVQSLVYGAGLLIATGVQAFLGGRRGG